MGYYYLQIKTELKKKEAIKYAFNLFNVSENNIYYYNNKKDRGFYICCQAESREDYLRIIRKDNQGYSVKDVKEASWCSVTDSRIIERYRVVPFTDRKNTIYKRILFLGTHITNKSIEKGFFYLGVSNPFWKLLSYVYDDNVILREHKTAELLFFECQRLQIAIADIIGGCYCLGAKDDEIIKESIEINPYLQELIDKADLIVFNGETTSKMFDELNLYVARGKKRIFVYGSSAPEPRGDKSKKELWKEKIGSIYR